MEEAAAEQETVTEGTTEVPNGTGTEGTEDIDHGRADGPLHLRATPGG